jgi:hypothetical protein
VWEVREATLSFAADLFALKKRVVTKYIPLAVRCDMEE